MHPANEQHKTRLIAHLQTLIGPPGGKTSLTVYMRHADAQDDAKVKQLLRAMGVTSVRITNYVSDLYGLHCV